MKRNYPSGHEERGKNTMRVNCGNSNQTHNPAVLSAGVVRNSGSTAGPNGLMKGRETLTRKDNSRTLNSRATDA
ncbi:hypothetical protein PO909_028593 [Leuciscus waleckii]